MDHSAQFVQSCTNVCLCHASTSKVIDEVADGMDRGGNGKWVFQWQQKTHTSYESVGFMFKVHRFGTLYFAVVHEVLRLRNLLISLYFIGGASRIRTADLWIMMKKFIKKPI
ncbi:MAG: hypothetical protein EBT49_08640 [Betaproteobacteria bacterium]|nr:hypothetical protein [Betaproteobacteria bacterium]